MATNRLLSRMTRAGSTSNTRTLEKLRARTKCLMMSRNARLVVQVGLEIGRVDRDQPLRGGGGGVHGGPRFGERGQNGQGFGGRPGTWGLSPVGLGRITGARKLRERALHVGFPG